MEISKKDRRALIFGAIGLGALALYLLVINPLANGYNQLVSEHERLAGKVTRVIRDNRKAEYITKQLAEWEDKCGKLEAPKPYDQQITIVCEQIFGASKKNKIKLRGATPATAKPWPDDPALQIASVHIDGEGDWQNVFKFITALYRIENLLGIEQIDLSSNPKLKGKLTIRLTVSVLVKAAPKSEGLWAS